jgi:hypothetical protein
MQSTPLALLLRRSSMQLSARAWSQLLPAVEGVHAGSGGAQHGPAWAASRGGGCVRPRTCTVDDPESPRLLIAGKPPRLILLIGRTAHSARVKSSFPMVFPERRGRDRRRAWRGEQRHARCGARHRA